MKKQCKKMNDGHNRFFCGEQGTTILEFTFSLFFFIFMLGSFFDIGLALYKWMLLRHETLEAAREIAVGFSTNPDCDAIEPYLLSTASTRLRHDLNTNIRTGDLSWNMQWLSPIVSGRGEQETFPRLRLTGRFPVDCYFLCHLFPSGWNLSATSETVIELEKFPNGQCSDLTVVS